ncbi:MAG: hypothetical protein QXD43_02195, partial [Candidatus Aenigmatarchaeota archaeon]
FSGIFASLTGTAGTAVTQTTSSMVTQFKIESAMRVGASSIGITIRNTGTQSFNASNQTVAIYINDKLIPSVWEIYPGSGCTVSSTNGYMLEKGCTVTYLNSNPGSLSCPTCPGICNNVTTVTIETGLSDSRAISCH